jgi:succinate-acetate transporter protein
LLTFCYYPGGFFLSFATTLTPSYNASAAYGTDVEQFHATFGFFPLFMGLLCVFYFVCSLRTNIVFATIFFFLVAALGLLTGGHWQIAQGHVDLAANINIVGLPANGYGSIYPLSLVMAS